MSSHDPAAVVCIKATPATCHWGVWSAALPPVAHVRSGAVVELETLSGWVDVMPSAESGLVVPPALLEMQRAGRSAPGHLLTGPIAVDGAQPGDMLEVRILDVVLGADWAWCAIRPFLGTLPDDFPGPPTVYHVPLNRERNVATLPFARNVEVPLAPFFGVLGVAPPAHVGPQSTIEPRQYGGNMDLRHLVKGTRAFLPVFNAGALFSAGDGHALQGDGESCLSALECCMTGRFQLLLHKGSPDAPLLSHPRAETAECLVSLGFAPSLDEAMRQAVREMVSRVVAETGLPPRHAYALLSIAGHFAVTQNVNREKGVHGLLSSQLVRAIKMSKL